MDQDCGAWKILLQSGQPVIESFVFVQVRNLPCPLQPARQVIHQAVNLILQRLQLLRRKHAVNDKKSIGIVLLQLTFG